jgi:hypothetical protein
LLTSWQPGSRDSRKGPGDKTCPSKACCPWPTIFKLAPFPNNLFSCGLINGLVYW